MVFAFYLVSLTDLECTWTEDHLMSLFTNGELVSPAYNLVKLTIRKLTKYILISGMYSTTKVFSRLQGNNEMELAEAEFILESLLDRISRLRKIKQTEPVSPPVSAPVGGKASYYSPQVGPKPPFLMMG